MKPSFRHLAFLAICLGVQQASHAVDFYWDGNSTGANADGGAGTWDAGITSNWDTLNVGGLDIIWPSSSSGNDDAFFGGTAGAVTIAGGGVTANSLTFTTAGYTLSGGSLTLDGTTPSISNGVAATISSSLLGSAGMNKTGNGTLTLSGDNSGLTGALVVSGATSGNNGGIIASGANSVAGFTSIEIQNNSFLQLNGVTIGSGVGISVAGGGGDSSPSGVLRGNSGVNVVNGAVTLANSSVRLGNLGTSTTFNGAITAAVGSGFGILIRNSSNQGTIFASASNYWEGETVQGEGSVYFHAGALPSASKLRIAGSGNTWFETNGSFTRSIGSGAGQIEFNNTTGRINGFSARGGNLTVNIGGAGAALTWDTTVTTGFSPGVLGLAGANATGTLTWQNAINLGGVSRTIDVANGSAATDAIVSGALSNGTLVVQGAGNLTLSGNNTLVTINKGAAGTDTGTLVLSGSNTFSNTTLTFGTGSQNRGAIRLENNNAIGGVTLIDGNGGTGGAVAQIQLANNVTITGTDYRTGGRTNATTTGAALVNVSGNNTWAGTVRISNTGGAYGIRSDAGQLTISGSLQNGIGSSRVWDLVGDGDFLISGTIVNGSTGSLAITKGGNGSLTVTGNSNTYSGGTTVSGGTLNVGNGGAGGSLGSGAITNNASLVFNRSDSFSVNNTISGSGSLTKQGAGTLTLGGTNSYTGVTTITAGTISVASLGNGGVSGNLGAATSAAANIVFGGGALQFSAASAASSNRGFTINTGSTGTINVSSASGELTLTGSVPTTTGIFYKTGVGALILDPGSAANLSFGALSANGGSLILKSGTINTTGIDSAVSAYVAGAGARGGALTIDGATLNVGGGRSLKPGASTNGTLNILSGAVNASSIVIGHNGSVTATQSGGTVTTTELYHQDAGNGTYNLSGGTLTARRIYNNSSNGSFAMNLDGGTLLSAAGTVNLIDTHTTTNQISVFLGAGNTIIDTTASSASIVRPMADMPAVAGTFTKAGSNTLTLTAANTYTGATTITGGTLALSGAGSIANSPAIIVGASTTFDVSGVTGGFSLAAGQTLSGPGTVAGTMNVAGTLAPGSSPGTLTTGSQTWLDGGDYNWQVLDALGSAGSGYDTISISGTLDLSSLTTGGYNINLWSLSSTGPDVSGNALNFVGTSSYSWLLASASSGITGFNATDFVINVGAFNGTDGFSNPLAGGVFSVTQSGNNLMLNFTAVPEPGAALLGGLGVLCLLRRRR